MQWRFASILAASLALAQAAAGQNVFPPNGNAGIGTMTPQGALHGVAPAGLPAAQNGLLLGTESNVGPHWIQSYGGPLVLNWRGNNVGIGVGQRAPTHTLDVGGPARFRTTSNTNLLVHGTLDDVHLDLTKQASDVASARITLDGFTDQVRHQGDIVFLTRAPADSALVERMRINADGTISVGTGEQVRVAGNQVRLLNANFAQLRLWSRQGACINELGGNEFSIADCLSSAEYAPTGDAGSGMPEPGDLVSVLEAENAGDAHAPFVLARSARACDSRLLGIISAPEAGASGRKLGNNYLPLAISGYFPVKVTMQNGPIRRGDPITSSARPGYGMRATGACRIVGYALENADVPGVVQVFANLGDHPGGDLQALQQQVQALQARLQALERQAFPHHAETASPDALPRSTRLRHIRSGAQAIKLED